MLRKVLQNPRLRNLALVQNETLSRRVERKIQTVVCRAARVTTPRNTSHLFSFGAHTSTMDHLPSTSSSVQ